MAADTGNSQPLCSLWWLMDVRCYIKALLTQSVILFKINSKVQILKTNLNTYNTCQKHTHRHTHTGKKKHILSTSYKHIENIFKTIQNINSKQKHIFKLYYIYIYTLFSIFDMLLYCYTDTFSHLPNINVTFFIFPL